MSDDHWPDAETRLFRDAATVLREAHGAVIDRLFATWKQDDDQKAADAPPTFSGAIVALRPDPVVQGEDGEQVARNPDGMLQSASPETVHLTLAHLGDKADLTDGQRMEIRAAVERVAARFPPLDDVQVAGASVIGDDDSVVALIDHPLLPDLRAAVVRAVAATGVEVSRRYGFIPHITVGWVEQGDSPDHVPRGAALQFTDLHLSLGPDGSPWDAPVPLQDWAGEPLGALSDAAVKDWDPSLHPRSPATGRFVERLGAITSAFDLQPGDRFTITSGQEFIVVDATDSLLTVRLSDRPEQRVRRSRSRVDQVMVSGTPDPDRPAPTRSTHGDTVDPTAPDADLEVWRRLIPEAVQRDNLGRPLEEKGDAATQRHLLGDQNLRGDVKERTADGLSEAIGLDRIRRLGARQRERDGKWSWGAWSPPTAMEDGVTPERALVLTAQRSRDFRERHGLPATRPPDPDDIDVDTVAHLRDDPDAVAEAYGRLMIQDVIDRWTVTSSDEDAGSIALQMAAADVTGDDPGAFIRGRWTLHQRAVSREDMAVLRAVVMAMRDRTRAQLREAGVEEVVVYRGMKWEPGEIPPVFQPDSGTLPEAELNPLSSWSLSRDQAVRFASGTRIGRVLRSTVAAEEIIALPTSGIGALHEQEVILGSSVRDISFDLPFEE